MVFEKNEVEFQGGNYVLNLLVDRLARNRKVLLTR
jgi:hypothetical protein